MKIVLLKNCPKLGNRLDIKEVKEGYARNFLIPNKMAAFADKTTLNQLSALQRKDADTKKTQQDNLTEIFEKLKKAKVQIYTKANKTGGLFAAVNEDDIRKAALQSGINLPDDCQIALGLPIKKVGLYEIEIISKNNKTKIPVTILEKK
jgi:large subunit ribosomal protein L9